MYDKYYVQKQGFGNETYGELAILGLDLLGTFASVGEGIHNVNQLGKMMKADGITGRLKQAVTAFAGDNRGMVDLNAFRGGKSSVQAISNKFPNDNQVGKRFNYTTENGRVHIENGVQYVDFVIDMDGNLHIGRGHSYLAGGSSVQAAGTMKVNSQGYIRLITNESGHFQPTTVQAMNYPTVFRNAGLNIDDAWIRIGEFETSMSNYVIDSKVFYNGPIKNMP